MARRREVAQVDLEAWLSAVYRCVGEGSGVSLPNLFRHSQDC